MAKPRLFLSCPAALLTHGVLLYSDGLQGCVNYGETKFVASKRPHMHRIFVFENDLKKKLPIECRANLDLLA